MIQRKSGVVVNLPQGVTLAPATYTWARHRTYAPGEVAETELPDIPLPLALGAGGLDLVDTLPIVTAPAGGRSVRSARAATIDVAVPVEDSEGAVILIEQDGYYTWQYPAEMASSPAQDAGRRSPRPARREVQFSIALPQDVTNAEAGRRRGLVGNLVMGRFRAFIFRFISEMAMDVAMAALERNIRTGLVEMTEHSPETWAFKENLRDFHLPTGRPSRILLFVHGTFSSTVGSYGALAASSWGRALLAAAREQYDAVIGYDHATLSLWPHDNAADLWQRLKSPGGTPQPQIDVVTYSRGGLVFRSWCEDLLAKVPVIDRPSIGRAIFVGVPHAGTHLADPGNWQRFADLYTNLVAGAARVLQLTGETIATTIVQEAMTGLAALVKYATAHALAETAVPGLAAMQPGCSFLTQLNAAFDAAAPGRPAYYAILSEFKERLLGGNHEPAELSKRLLLTLADATADQLFGCGNDLVVDTTSMCAIGTDGTMALADRFDMGTTPYVYHTIYFTRPEVTAQLGTWLELEGDFGASPALAEARYGSRRRWPGATAGTRLAVLPPGAMVADLAAALAAEPLDYVVVERTHNGEILRYALGRDEAVAIIGGMGTERLETVLHLHETDASPVTTPWTVDTGRPTADGRLSAARTVVMEGDAVVGVRPAADETMSSLFLWRQVADAEPVLPPAAGLSPAAGQTQQQQQERPGAIWEDKTASSGERRPIPVTTVERRLASLSTVPSNSQQDFTFLDYVRMKAPSSEPDILAYVEMEGTGVKWSAITPEVAPATATAAATPPAVKLHAGAECAGTMVVDTEQTVAVTLSREQIAQVVGMVSAATGFDADPSVPIAVEIWPRQGFKPIERAARHREVPVPSAGVSARLEFRLTPGQIGEGEIWVLLTQNGDRLGDMELHVSIVASAAEPPRPVQATLQVSTAGVGPQAQQLQVFERIEPNGDVIYHYVLNLPGLILNEFTSGPIKNRDAYIDGLYRDIESRWIRSQGDSDQFQQDLENFGADLFDQLFPKNMQQSLWQHRLDIKDIWVVAQEPFIPWEMILLKEPGGVITPESFFLAQRGLTRWLLGRPSTDRLPLRQGHVRVVCPQYMAQANQLPWAQREAVLLQERHGAVSVPATIRDVQDLLGQEDGFDILHIASHGTATSGDIRSAQVLLRETSGPNGSLSTEPLLPTTVKNRARLDMPLGRRPLAFVNACQLGRSGFQLTGMGGFAQAFLGRGAGAFIGTLWSVDDAAAFLFTEIFYQELFDGSTLAEATIKAREAARARGDASWLAYTVYGDPRARKA